MNHRLYLLFSAFRVSDRFDRLLFIRILMILGFRRNRWFLRGGKYVFRPQQQRFDNVTRARHHAVISRVTRTETADENLLQRPRVKNMSSNALKSGGGGGFPRRKAVDMYSGRTNTPRCGVDGERESAGDFFTPPSHTRITHPLTAHPRFRRRPAHVTRLNSI